MGHEKRSSGDTPKHSSQEPSERLGDHRPGGWSPTEPAPTLVAVDPRNHSRPCTSPLAKTPPLERSDNSGSASISSRASGGGCHLPPGAHRLPVLVVPFVDVVDKRVELNLAVDRLTTRLGDLGPAEQGPFLVRRAAVSAPRMQESRVCLEPARNDESDGRR